MPDITDALGAAVEATGGKWKVLILHQLLRDTQRFGELRKEIPAITQKVLAQSLRELESAGLIERRAYGGMPPRVDYSLTEHGRTLAPVVQILAEWGQAHLTYQAAIAPVDNRLSQDELTEAVRAAAM